MKGFFSRPFEFSFKDFLAICFSGTFLFITYKAIKSKDALEVMKTLIPIISIILGGYFGQEMVSAYFQSKNPYQQYNGYYTGYVNYTQPTYTQTETQEESEQQNNSTPSI